MNLQWHPGSARATVRRFDLAPRRQRISVVMMGSAAALLVLLPLTASVVLTRWRHQASEQEASMLNARRREAVAVATSGLRETNDRLSYDRDLLLRASFLYDALTLFSSGDPLSFPAANPEARLDMVEHELALLSRVTDELTKIESDHPLWAGLTPSVSPVPETAFVLARPFGWWESPLTGQNEFSSGVEIGAPAGTPVFAPAAGVVRWAGNFPMRLDSPYAHEGRLVAVRHGDRAVTVFGRLDSVLVRRGQSVRRGEKIGTVGTVAWLEAARLHYEVWRVVAGDPVPVDPLLTMLNMNVTDVSVRVGRASKSVPKAYTPLPSEFR